MGVVTHTTSTMQYLVLFLAATTMALPAYKHVEIPAEPYVHQEIPAAPHRIREPELDALTLGQVRPGQQNQQYRPQQYQNQQYQNQQYQQPQQYAPQQPAGYANGPQWGGRCINNKGEGVECRKKFWNVLHLLRRRAES